MSGSKHFEKIAWSVTALMLVLTILFMNGASLGLEVMEHTMGYEERLFDKTRVHTIDIVMDDWDELIQNATSEEYYLATVVIDGQSYKNVGIRAKGNTSLSTVASLGSERYSFKIEFDHYDSSKSYYGLDKLSLNNLIQDSTMMKDYLTYTMMNEFGVNSSLCSYVYITVNGEDWGLYLAVEGVEDAFLERNYGADQGELYKPDSQSIGGGRGNGRDFDMDDFDFENMEFPGQIGDMEPLDGNALSGGGMPGAGMPAMGETSGEKNFDPSALFGAETENRENTGAFGTFDISGIFNQGGDVGFGGMGSSDVKLQYVDDELDSYSNIWNNAKTDITEEDQYRLIDSLKKLSDGEEIASVVDVEQVIRYFVVHNYVCNGDSYTGSMVHNYYLYEKEGQLAMIPWDYNLAFGTFQGGNAQSTVNTPIDSPVEGGNSSDRPMWNWILSDAEYTELYHEYFAEFLSSVDIQSIIDDAYELICDYVEKDPTAFYTYEEFEQGVKTLQQFCKLRSESILQQLANNETVTTQNYADASAINLSDMGSMGMGMGDAMANLGADRADRMDDAGQDDPFRMPQSGGLPMEQGGAPASDRTDGTMPTMPESGMETMPGGFDEMPLPQESGRNNEQNGSTDVEPSAIQSNPEQQRNKPAGGSSKEGRENDRMQMPAGGMLSSEGDIDGSGTSRSTLYLMAASAVVLALGFAIAKCYKRY